MFVVLDLGLLFFALSLVHQSDLDLLVELHLLAHLLLGLGLHVAATLVDDVTCLLAGLLDLFERTAFLLLQQVDAVAEESEVVLCTLSGQFGGNKLLVESGIIVLFIRRQVHLVLVISLDGKLGLLLSMLVDGRIVSLNDVHNQFII